jgi:murein DD-endopeptidase / murein LD-carboxypeptidase
MLKQVQHDEGQSVGDRIAAEALALVGTPFRLRGRDRQTGLDCVGLALSAFGGAGVPAVEPPAYQLRGTSRERAETVLRRAGLVPADAEKVGDLILAESGPMQLHLMIRAGAGPSYVHAHAALGRVVLMPGPISLPVLSIWRAE